MHLDADGEVVFKAELGAVTPEVTQVQGVWMNPEFRGLGLSAGYMAAVVVLAQTLAPVTSLYVNDFNARARATYERVGFRQVGRSRPSCSSQSARTAVRRRASEILDLLRPVT